MRLSLEVSSCDRLFCLATTSDLFFFPIVGIVHFGHFFGD